MTQWPGDGVALAHRISTCARGRHGLRTADLQRDLGGAIMQSILGALLARATTAGTGGTGAGEYRGDAQLD
ncbi:MAG: hypothetical protein ACRD0P_13435 [Stackebrandtia sp.]